MRGHALRKFVASRLSDLGWLRREVPAALPLAGDPAALVLSAMGHFYRQGRNAYARPSQLVNARRACILLLEFYILSGCLPSSAAVDPAVRKAAVGAALSWRDRLIKEGGGVHAAGTVDALGLTLFVGCFGIPREFSSKEMYDLLRSSKLKKKAHVLRQSSILLSKLPGKSHGSKELKLSPSRTKRIHRGSGMDAAIATVQRQTARYTAGARAQQHRDLEGLAEVSHFYIS